MKTIIVGKKSIVLQCALQYKQMNLSEIWLSLFFCQKESAN